MKPFSNGKFVKECILAAVDLLCSEEKKVFANVSLSSSTVTRRIEDIAENFKLLVKDIAGKFQYYSIALDEAMIYVTRHNLQYLCVVLHLTFILLKNLYIGTMKGRTTGVDLFNAVKNVLEEFNLNLENIFGVLRNGFEALLDKYCKENGSERDLVKIHCLIHQEALCAKSIKLKNVMEIIVKSVNFVRSRGLNHRQF